jgi:phosphonate transport system substrate-binding protein
MKFAWFSRFVMVGLLMFSSGASIHAEEKVYTVGVVPQFEARRLHQIWRPILNELESRTGLKFQIVGSPTIPDFEKEFMAGNFDFAYMNPYHVVLASQLEGYVPLVRDVARTLFGVLVVRTDSGITDVKQLDGAEIAFPSPNALGASLQMRQELVDKFNIQVKPKYVKTHDSVYLNVALRQTAAGGGVQKTLNRQKADIKDSLKVIHETTPVSPHPLAAHPRVPEEVQEKVLAALLGMGETEMGRELLSKIPIKTIGRTSMDDYVPLKEMGLERFYVNP